MSTSTRALAAARPLPRLPLLAGCGTLLLWSGTPIANKVAVAYMSGLAAGVLRSSIAGSIAVIVGVALRLPLPSTRRDRWTLALSGIASFAAWPMLFSVAIERTTAGHAALILATIPIVAVLLACALTRRWPTPGWWLGAAVAIGGAVFIVLGQGLSVGLTNDGASVQGDLIMFLGGVVCAVGYVAGGRLAPRIGTAATTFWGLGLALLVLAPVLIFEVAPHTDWSSIGMRGWLAMGWLALLSSLLAYAFWFYALGSGGIGRISSLLLVMPAITLAAAALVLDETISVWLAASCAAVVLGTYLAQRYSG